MGTWSCQAFGNDAALDWLDGLEESGFALSYLEGPLDRVLNAGSAYVESTDAEEAIAAAEVLARLMGAAGTQHDAYTQRIDEWIASARSRPPPPELHRKAIAVLERVAAENSELRELWEESGEISEWIAELTLLSAGIQAVSIDSSKNMKSKSE